MAIFDWLRPGRLGSGHPRWVVVDVETSGMNVASDAVISIGAVAVVDGRVVPGDSLEIIVKQATASSRENILVHGVGAHAQLNGTDPPHAVRVFMDYIGQAPMLAFHAPFDRGFLVRVIKHYINQPFDNPWLDVADLAPALSPETRLKSLDEWLEHFGIPVAVRHSAASDAFATALLVARLLPAARRQGASSFAAMQKLARQAKWLH
jgi:DNA polymerase-3 subunit epsilon